MKRLIKVICFALVAGLMLYGVVNGGFMIAYRLAHAVSLPPAVTNLLPFVLFAGLWFIASRFIKYFQRRAASTGRKLISADEEHRREAWLQIKSKGRKQFVWRRGVLGWGLPVFVIFTPVMLLIGPRTHDLTLAEIVGFSLLSLPLWLLGGYWFGTKTWRRMEDKYGR